MIESSLALQPTGAKIWTYGRQSNLLKTPNFSPIGVAMRTWKRDLLKVLHYPTSKSHSRIFNAAIAIALVVLAAPTLSTAAGTPLRPLSRPLYSAAYATSSTQLCYNNQINIDPPTPSSTTLITISPSGLWCDSCVPKYQQHQIVDNVINIYAIANPFGYACAMILTPWKFGITVGPLAAGNYTVQVFVSRFDGAPTLNDSKSFTVMGPISIQFLPIMMR